MSRTDADFIAAAVKLVNEHGFEYLTSRHLGEAMGVHSTAIYRHFPQWDLLVMAVTDAYVGLLLMVEGAGFAAIGNPRERIAAMSRAVRKAAETTPEIAENLLKVAGAPRTVATPNIDELVRIVVNSLREWGLAGNDLARCYQVLESYTTGSAAIDFAGAPGHLTNRLDRRRIVGIPEFAQAMTSVEDIERVNAETFEFGLQALLDAIEAVAVTGASSD